MDVVDLLIDHPAAPEWFCFETFLPNLMSIFSYGKAKSTSRFNKILGSFALQVATEFNDAAVLRIGNEVEVIRHQHIGNELSRPLFIKFVELLKKGNAAGYLSC